MSEAPRLWIDCHSRVETLALRDGVTLVLSDIGPAEQCAFQHVETEDVFAIGFHLKGGSQFDIEGARFRTGPLEVHAGAAPRGAASSFALPSQGFRTVSLRFPPDAAGELLARQGLGAGPLAAMAAQAHQAVSMARLAPLDPASVTMIEAMFAASYRGAGRSLFLESCALGLLAAQFEAASPAPGEATFAPLERALAEARAYLDAHLDDPPSIVQLARISGINDFKLKRAFKNAFGTTIFGYVRQRRMERAAGNLHAGLSVSQAAAKAGYECPRCFTDAFRRHFGVLPSAVTRSSLAKTPGRYG